MLKRNKVHGSKITAVAARLKNAEGQNRFIPYCMVAYGDLLTA